MGQHANFRVSAGRQANVELQVKAVLTRSGVMPGLNHFYMDFGKKLASLARRHKAATLQDEACIEKERWLARGLSSPILEEIILLMGLRPCYVPPIPTEPFSYDFSTGAGVNKWCWKGDNADQPPAIKDIGGVELGAGDYAKKGADDNTFAGSSYFGVAKRHAYMLMRFDIAEDRTKITSLTLADRVECGTDGGKLYVWNGTTGQWELVDSTALTTMVTLTKTYNAGITDYIDGSGQLWMLMEANAVFFMGVFWLSEVWNYYAKVSGVWQP